VVILSYVQRFKRAKAFFRKARRWFNVEAIPRPPVVDYDALCWSLPVIAQAEGGARAEDSATADGAPSAQFTRVVVTDASALYSTYLAALVRAGDAAAAGTASASAAAAAAAAAQPPVDATSGSAPAAQPAALAATAGASAQPERVYHAVDSSDSEGEGFLAGMSTVGLHDSAPGSGDDDADAPGRPAVGGVDAGTLTAARRAAATLGLRLADPLDAYIYILRRR
jgi:hypothetical protein